MQGVLHTDSDRSLGEVLSNPPLPNVASVNAMDQ